MFTNTNIIQPTTNPVFNVSANPTIGSSLSQVNNNVPRNQFQHEQTTPGHIILDMFQPKPEVIIRDGVLM
jgi:hypothetical protein